MDPPPEHIGPSIDRATAFSIKRIAVHGLHGRTDIELDLHPDINILYGRNGSGKTTLLHILANVLNGSLERFAYLGFDTIRIEMTDGRIVEVQRGRSESPDRDRIQVTLDGEHVVVYSVNAVLEYDAAGAGDTSNSWQQILALKVQDRSYYDQIIEAGQAFAQQFEGAAYFPAFRTMIEAWRSVEDSNSVESFQAYLAHTTGPPFEKEARLTKLARDLFGRFVPSINYPSVIEIEQELRTRVASVEYAVARIGEEILSEAFVQAFAALSEAEAWALKTPELILHEIEELLRRLDESEIVDFPEARRGDVYGRLRDVIPLLQTGEQSDTAARVLAVYRDSLDRRVQLQRHAFEPIERYVESVNEFLEGKRVAISGTRAERQERRVSVEFADGVRESLRALSSGERQIVSMLYAVSRMDRPRVVLIDEPELSLHIDWQRLLVSRLAEQLEARQLVVCTHSPEIGAEYEDNYQEIRPSLPAKIVQLPPASEQ